MAESETTPTNDEPTGSTESEEEAPPSEDEVRLLRAALKKANRDGEAARSKLKEREDADLSEVERLTKSAEAAEQRAKASEMELVRHRVAATKGLPPELASRLQGTTEAEMAADADQLAALVKARTPGVPSGVRPPANNDDDMNVRLRRATGRAS